MSTATLVAEVDGVLHDLQVVDGGETFALVVAVEPSDESWTSGSVLVTGEVTAEPATAELRWDASPTAGVEDYSVFRRSPPTGEPFDPETDTPIADGIVTTAYDDEGLTDGDYEWQIYGRTSG